MFAIRLGLLTIITIMFVTTQTVKRPGVRGGAAVKTKPQKQISLPVFRQVTVKEGKLDVITLPGETILPIVNISGKVDRSRVIPIQLRIESSSQIIGTPKTGFLIIQCQNGEVETIINGEHRKRTEKEFWTVGKNASLSLLVKGDPVLLQIWAINIHED